ncbi:hypothetical protein QBC34DRAFT_387635 [Podospora aff. communis PSN243]|uniref:Uncharacterized protein n=1 Tax=Podospora aff. communis PSN243 TaxID=3040156 RepID=A0AAV9G4J1_9PEZI|nr:hypothetical protein QBC34DRAFT_387635 [Podospora aff. communis PSN243]
MSMEDSDISAALRKAGVMPDSGWPRIGKEAAARVKESGLACHIAMLQYILGRCFSSPHVAKLFTSEQLKENLLLEAVISPDGERCVDIARRLIPSSEPLSSWMFEGLMKNDTMDKTLWQDPLAWLFNQRHIMQDGLMVFEPDAAKHISEISVIPWDGVEPSTVSDAVKAHIDKHLVFSEAEIRACHAPTFIRLRLENKTGSDIHIQRQLLQLQYEGRPLDCRPVDGLEDEFRLYLDEPHALEYRSVAVVLTRREENDMDRICLFDIDGTVLRSVRPLLPSIYTTKIPDGATAFVIYIRVPPGTRIREFTDWTDESRALSEKEENELFARALASATKPAVLAGPPVQQQ